MVAELTLLQVPVQSSHIIMQYYVLDIFVTSLPQGGCSYRIQYNLITRLLPACDQLTTCIQPCDHIVHGPYKVKTTLLQGCCQLVMGSQPAHNLVIWLLQGCDNLYQVVTRLLQPCDFCMGYQTYICSACSSHICKI